MIQIAIQVTQLGCEMKEAVIILQIAIAMVI